MVMLARGLFEREAVRSGHPRLKKHDTRLGHVSFEPALERERDLRLLQFRRRLEAEVLGLAAGPAHRGVQDHGDPRRLDLIQRQVGLGRPVQYEPELELPGPAAAP